MKKLIISAVAFVSFAQAHAETRPVAKIIDSLTEILRPAAFGGNEIPDSDDEQKLMFKSATCLQTPDGGFKADLDYRQNEKLTVELSKIDNHSFLVTRTSFVKKDNEYSVHEITMNDFKTFASLQEALKSNSLNEKKLKILNAEDAVQIESSKFKFSNPNSAFVQIQSLGQTASAKDYKLYLAQYSQDTDDDWSKTVARRNSKISATFGPGQDKTAIAVDTMHAEIIKMFQEVCTTVSTK